MTINRKNFTQATVASLAMAVEQYHTEYEELPRVAGRVTTDTGDGVKLLHILQSTNLRDIESQNHRSIRFLSIKEGRNNRSGLIYDSTGNLVVGLYDDWGSPITVVLDTNEDQVLKFKLGSKKVRLEGRRVAAFSPGKDRKLGTPDDVRSW